MYRADNDPGTQVWAHLLDSFLLFDDFVAIFVQFCACESKRYFNESFAITQDLFAEE